MSVRVKICGVTRVEDAIAAVDAGADLIGLNFYAKSPRHLGLERALEITRAMERRAKLVGVFVYPTHDLVAQVHRTLALDFVQLYDDDAETAVRDIPVPVIRALRLKPGTSPGEFGGLLRQTRAEYVLLDTYDPNLHGGTGKPLNLGDLARLDLSRAFIAGGLTPDTVGEAARLGPYGVDVASGVESAPGVKDHHKLRSFIRNAKFSQ